jgi:cell division protein ZapD
VTSQIVFEQPLNERIRTFLRIEQLMQRIDYFISGDHAWDSHCAITTLLEISDLASRGDLKSELMKELKRQIKNLEGLKQIQEIDQSQLQQFIDSLCQHIDTLYELSGHPGAPLKNNEFLKSIRQRIVIPGGTCDFDLPAYHFWLSQHATERRATLKKWINPFQKVYNTISVIMSLIRDSATPKDICAARGFYQQQLDNDQPYQLIRVLLPIGSVYFPEISAGKHRYTVRFLVLNGLESRPSQIQDDIEFKLACCSL